MPTIKLNDVSLEYSEKGQGGTVLFVHGSASDLRTWDNQVDEFSKYFRVIAYSRRYHWPNQPIPDDADYSMLQHVDDLHKLLQSLNISRPHLAGHSYGALVCLLLALREPDIVKSLILAEPPALRLFTSDPPKPRELLGLFFRRPRTALSILKFGMKGVVPATKAIKNKDIESAIRSFGIATLGQKTFEALSQSRFKQVRANFFKAEITGSGFAPLDKQKIRSLNIPVLLVTSQNSPGMFRLLSRRLEELLPNIEKVLVPSASHIMYEDNPSFFNSAVLSFLNDHSE